MPLQPSRPITVAIARSIDDVYAYAADPQRMAQWAAGLGSGLSSTDNPEVWTVETPAGQARVRFSPHNPYGVLDHWVTQPDGGEVYIPLRVVANGDGAEVTLTLFRLPEMDDAAFEADAAAVTHDLQTLKARLEG
ncbi:SRPBCC family protein [Caulobacter hibisci]|uniref:SRPBCC family protein n=1 Tax=Caulobacter hibisci TaxID=2035993 RepID=A0ABS0SXZ3_9CAUL|nr:SRPBCC family protein [Caulobacter hibisci]MBI1684512.1 SRPBCC family protein [Caulobacter hibisci]